MMMGLSANPALVDVIYIHHTEGLLTFMRLLAFTVAFAAFALAIAAGNHSLLEPRKLRIWPELIVSRFITATTQANGTATSRRSLSKTSTSSPLPGRPDQPGFEIKFTRFLSTAFFTTVPDNIWAVDARSGHRIWHFSQPTKKGLHIGHRGVAMLGIVCYLQQTRI